MQKLVLGIIGVTLLQIAFFVHVAMEESASQNEVASVKTGTGVITSALPRLDESTSSPLEADTLPENRPRTRPVSRGKSGSAYRRPGRAVESQAALPARVVRTNSSIASARTSRPTDKLHTVTARVEIPRGYTMVLVDHLPNSRVETMKVSERKERSGKRLPAVVRKPWNWIKSVGSKLF